VIATQSLKFLLVGFAGLRPAPINAADYILDSGLSLQ